MGHGVAKSRTRLTLSVLLSVLPVVSSVAISLVHGYLGTESVLTSSSTVEQRVIHHLCFIDELSKV